MSKQRNAVPKFSLVGGLVIGGLLATNSSSEASLLVYEGFNQGLANGVTLVGKAPSGTGLSGNFIDATPGGGTANFDAVGLSFGSIPTTGGSLKFTAPTGQYRILAASLSATATGTVYESYLTKLTTNAGGVVAGNGSFTRITNLPGATAGERLALMTETKSTSTGPGVGYDGTNAGVAGEAGSALATGTTYLLIARYTNVGLLNTVGTPGTASMWALDLPAFTAWQAAGGSEATLPTFATFQAADSVTSGTYGFSSGNGLQMATSASSGTAGGITANFDEIRFGTTLADVVPVPEPASLGLLIAGVATLSRRRRRLPA